MKEEYQNIIDHLKPFVVANKLSLSCLHRSFYGKEVEYFDPLELRSAPFFASLPQVDKLSFESSQMVMDKWAFLDCAALPGAIVGFMAHKELLGEKVFAQLNYDCDWLPISLFMAIPTMTHNVWFGHNLSSLGRKIEKPLKGLGVMTKLLGIKVLGIKNMMGATQWGNIAVKTHLKLGPLRLMSSWTPNHSHPNTLTYWSDYGRSSSFLDKDVVWGKSDFAISSGDIKAQQQLQLSIERGENFEIVAVDLKKQDLNYLVRKA